MQELSSLVAGLLAVSGLSFKAVTSAFELDVLLSTRGVDTARPALVTAFRRSIIGVGAPPLSLLDAATFLLRLFLLDSDSRSALFSMDAQERARDSLLAFISGLPQSTDRAQLPQRWVETAGDMVTALCGELSVSRLKQRQKELGVVHLLQLTVRMTLLLALCPAPPSNSAANSSWNRAMAELCQFVSWRIELAWRPSPFCESLWRCVEGHTLSPLPAVLELLARQPPAMSDEPGSSWRSPLLGITLTLSQRLLSLLSAQLALLPDFTWRYPHDVSRYFPQPSQPTLCGASVTSGGHCAGDLCQRLHAMLTSPLQHVLEIRAAAPMRAHIERRIQSLPHPTLIEYVTYTTRSPYTLVVSLSGEVVRSWDRRRATLRALVARLSAGVASCSCRPHASVPSSASSPEPSSVPPSSDRSAPLQPAAAALSGAGEQAAAPQGSEYEAVPPSRRKRKQQAIELDEDDPNG